MDGSQRPPPGPFYERVSAAQAPATPQGWFSQIRTQRTGAVHSAPLMESARDITAYRRHWAARFGTAPFLPMSREEMDLLGWDSCDVIVVTGDAYVDHPSFGMAIIGRVLEAQGFRVGIIAQPDWHSAEPFRALGRPNLFFGITAPEGAATVPGLAEAMKERESKDARQ